MLGLLAACLLQVSPQAYAASAAPANFSAYPDLSSCVEQPDHDLAVAKTGASAARLVGNTGLVHVFELDGDYSRGLTAPRLDVARTYFSQRPDEVDFLVVFTGFEFATGDAQAFYNPVKNDVEGIGQPIFDNSARFGSSGRLQGYVDMAALSRYELNPRSPGFKPALNTMGHELMHRWGVGVRFIDTDGSRSSALIGRDGAHWSLLADTSASVMFGARWHEVAPGEFRIVEARERFSDWDLYLAGLAHASEVAPLRLLRGSALDPTDLPSVGLSTTASAQEVRISQLVQAEGARLPDASTAQRNFRAALVFLGRPGETPDPADLMQLQRFALSFESYFQSITDGRASLKFIDAAGASSGSGSPVPISGGPLLSHADPVAAGLVWLKSRQSVTGAWSDRPSSRIRDTTAAIAAIRQLDPTYEGLSRANDFLRSQNSHNSDDALQQVHAGHSQTMPTPARDGGTAIRSGWVSSPFDSALAAWIDAETSLLSAAARGQVHAYLASTQAADGGFSTVANGAGRLRVSLYAARALLRAFPGSSGSAPAARARDWVIDRLLSSQLQGQQAVPVSEIAEALQFAGALQLPESLRLRLRQALAARQGAAGDWEGSIHTTAVATLALTLQAQPNLVVRDLQQTPSPAVRGEPIRLSVTVANTGGQRAPASTLQWHLLSGGGPTPTAVGSPIELAPLLSGDRAVLSLQIESSEFSADALLRATVDPQDAILEVSEADNSAELRLLTIAASAPLDLGLYPQDVRIEPIRYTRIGERIRVEGVARNLGTQAAMGAELQLERLLSGGRQRLAEIALDVGPGASQVFLLEFEVQALGVHELELSIVAGGTQTDSRLSNNRIPLRLSPSEGFDLAVATSQLQVLPEAPELGEDVRIRARVRNAGTVDAPASELALELETPQGWDQLQRRTVTALAGAQVDVDFVWRPEREGLHRLRVSADPDNALAELDEVNNLAPFDVEIGRSIEPDLLVVPGSVRVTPGVPLQGRALDVAASVRNIGAGRAPANSAALFFGDPQGGGQRLAVVRLEDGLAAGAETTLQFSVERFPARGDVSLFVLVDSDLEVDERSELNNLGIAEATALGLPDLHASSASFQIVPESPVQGLPVSARVRVSNLGEQASAPALIHLYERAQGVLRAVGQPLQLPAIGPGDSASPSWEWQFGQLENVDSLYVQIDPEQAFEDATRGNNEASLILAVQPGRAYASVPYFSPNGDGIKDRTTLLFDLGQEPLQKIEVRDERGQAVAELATTDAGALARIAADWDGTDAAGRAMPDGVYYIAALTTDARSIGPVRVVLDTDRPMALDAVGTEAALVRRLPASVHAWQRAAAGSRTEDYLYTRGNQANAANALKRGIARTHALFGGVEPVLSARWLDRNGASDVVDLMLNERADGQLVFTLASPQGSVWVQDPAAFDQPRQIGTVPAVGVELRILGLLGDTHVLLGPAAGFGRFWMLSLQSGIAREVDTGNSAARLMQVYPSGVLFGVPSNYADTTIPALFVPADPAAPPVDVVLPQLTGADCLLRAHALPSQPRLIWHRQTAFEEVVVLVDLESGESRTLFESQGPSGCYAGSQSRPAKDAVSGRAGYAEARAFWLEERAEAVLVDYSNQRLQRFSARGNPLDSRPLTAPLRVEGYVDTVDNSSVWTDLGDPHGASERCPARVAPSWSGLARSGQFERRLLDPRADELFLSWGEIVADREPGLYVDAPPAVCEGATDLIAVSLGSPQIRSLGGLTAWPLRGEADTQRYPMLRYEAQRAVLPAAWPVFFQSAGVHLRSDGRVERSDGSLSRPWALAGTLLDASHEETRLELGSGSDPSRLGAVLSSLDRLRAELRASSNGRSVELSGFATDRNLDHYLIEYAHAHQPERWLMLQAPVREQVRQTEFLTWAPPSAGAYLFRLSVVDRAGNVRRSHASAELAFASPISSVRRDHRAISPNGDSVQDSVELSFVVARATELGLRVRDLSGALVYSADRVFGSQDLGDQNWVWDGRNQSGQPVVDGRYRLELTAGFAFPVAVDTVFPSLGVAEFRPLYPPAEPGPGVLLGGVLDPMGTAPSAAGLEVDLLRRQAEDPAWAVWAENVLPPGESEGAVRMQYSDVFGFRYRVRVSDAAGNAVSRDLTPAPPLLVLLGTPEVPRSAVWQSLPPDSSRAENVPQHTRPGTSGLPTVIPRRPASSIHFLSDKPDPGAVKLDLARSLDDFAGNPGLDWRTVADRVPTRVADHVFSIEADLSDFAMGERLALRLRGDQASGLESNAFMFATGDISYSCVDPRGSLVVSALLGDAVADIELRLQPLGVTQTQQVLRPVPNGPWPTGSFRVEFQLPRGLNLNGISAQVLATLANGARELSPPTRLNACVTPGGGGGPNASLQINPTVNPQCGSAPTRSVRIRVDVPASVATQFKLELLDPTTTQPRLIAEGPRSAIPTAGFEVDTSNLLEGEARVRLQLTSSAGEVTTILQTFPVDRSPAELAIQSPVAGSRVCATQGSLDGVVNGHVLTDTRALFAMEQASAIGPESRFDAFACSAGDPSLCRVLDEQPFASEARLSARSRSGPLANLVNPATGAALVSEGPVELRLRALDWSGAMACTTVRVEMDSAVSLSEVRDPESILHAQSGGAIPAIAPQGDAAHRVARWFLRAREPLQLNVVLHRARATGLQGPRAFEVVEGPLQTVLAGARPAGELSIVWNGEISGQAADDGVYALRIQAQDDCGHTATMDRFVRVDATPPELQLLAPPSGTGLRAAAVQVVGSLVDVHPDTYQIEVSRSAANGPWTEIASGRGNVPQARALGVWQTAGATGRAWIRLRARDALGNRSEVSSEFEILPRPEVLASARLANPVFSPNADGVRDELELMLVLQRDARVDVEIRSSAGTVLARPAQAVAFASGPVRIVWNGMGDAGVLADNTYRVHVAAVDQELGGEPDTAELDAGLDTQAPALAWLAPDTDYVSCEGFAALEVSDTWLLDFTAELRSSAGAVLRSGGGSADAVFELGGFAGLAEGDYELLARAQDSAGNRSEQRRAFTLDCGPPSVTLDAPRAGTVLARAADRSSRVVGAARDPHLRRYRLSVAPIGTPGNRSVLQDVAGEGDRNIDFEWRPEQPDGDYLLHLEAWDAAGNLAEQRVPVRIDGTPPIAAILDPLDGQQIASTLQLKVNATDDNFAELRVFAAVPAAAERGEWSLLYRSEQAVSGDFLPPFSLDLQGALVLKLEVEDQAGLIAFDQVRVEIDTLPPPVPIQLSATAEAGGNVRLVWQGGDAPDLSGFFVFRQSATEFMQLNVQALPQRSYLDRDLDDGEWSYYVVAQDRVGNRSQPSNLASARVDRTPPEARLLSPRNGERLRGRVEVSGTAYSADDFAGFELVATRLVGGDRVVLRESTQPVRSARLAYLDTLQYPEDTRIQLALDARDTSGNRSGDTVEVVIDNQPPAAPTGLAGSEVGDDLDLRWNPNSEPDLLGYLLYRNGRLLTHAGALPGDLRPLTFAQNAYLDQAAPDGPLAYRAYAVDTAGNVSPPSAPWEFIRETGPPHAEIVQPSAGLVFDRAIEVVAHSEDRDIASVAFLYRAAGATPWTAIGDPVTQAPWRRVLDPGALAFGEFELTAVATDTGGLVDPAPTVVRVRYADLTPPPAPQGVRAYANAYEAHIGWTHRAEPDLAGYRVERQAADGQWQPIHNGLLAGPATVDPARPEGASRYRVRALDTVGNVSIASTEVEAFVFGLSALYPPLTPTAQTSSQLSARSPRNGSAQLVRRWSDGEDALAAGAVQSGQTFNITDVALRLGVNSWTLRVEDALGNRSIPAATRVTRGALPPAPAALSGAVDGLGVQLEWQAPSGPPPAGYRIYRNGTALQLDAPSTDEVQAQSAGSPLPQVNDGDPQTVWVEQAATLSDALSGELQLSWVTTRLVGGLEIRWQSADRSARDFDLFGWFDERWNLLAEVRNQQGDTYRLVLPTAYPTEQLRLVPRRAQRVGGQHALAEVEVLLRAIQSATTYTDLVANGRHEYRVAAVSALGFEGPRSPVWVAEVGDSQAPQPVVLAGQLDGRNARLTWTASTAADLARYTVYRNGRRVADVAAGTTQYDDANLANGRYAYRVTADDAVGNASAPSNEIVLEVTGSLPGVPSFVNAVAHAQQPALYLHWQAGAGVTPARYRLHFSSEREGVTDPYRELARPSTSPWLHAGLSYGQRLFYRIQAEDAFGNLSALSAPFEAVVRDVSTPPIPHPSWPGQPGQALDWRQSQFDVCGLAEPGVTVEVLVNDRIGGSALASAQASLTQVSLDSGALAWAALSPDGRRLVWSEDSGRSYLRDLLTGTQRDLALDPLQQAAFSADGEALIGIDLARRVVRAELGSGASNVVDLGMESIDAFASDVAGRRWLVQGSREGTNGVWRVDLDSGQAQVLAITEPVDTLRFGGWPNSTIAYARTRAGRLLRVDVVTGNVTAVDVGGELADLDLARTDDSVLVRLRDASGSRVLLARNGQPVRLLHRANELIADARLSPDGREFALLYGDRIERRRIDDGSRVDSVVRASTDVRALSLQWTPSGALLVAETNSRALTLIAPAGQFCVRGLRPVVGLNQIETVAERKTGSRSLRSRPIDLSFEGSQQDQPDAAISAQDIRFLPARGILGQAQSAVLSVHNRGRADVGMLEVEVRLISPAGDARRFVRETTVAPSGVAVLHVPLGVLEAAGDYQLRVVLDPDAEIDELDESNNTAQQALSVGTDSLPLLRLGANASTRPAGARFEGEARVETVSAFQGRLRLAVVDAAGETITQLSDQATGAIGGLSAWSTAWSWEPPASTFAGEYFLAAKLFDPAGNQVRSEQLALRIESQLSLQLSLQPLQAQAAIGTGVPIELGLDYPAGNQLIAGGQLRLRAIAPSGAQQLVWSGSSGMMLPGYSLRRTLHWLAAPAEVGTWRLRAEFNANGIERTLERSVELVPASTTTGLRGQLQLQPGLALPLGQAAQLLARVENAGLAGSGALPLRVRVFSVPASEPLLSHEQGIELAAGQSLDIPLELVGLANQPATYVAVLEVQREGQWRLLAQRGFGSIDVQAPELLLLSPGEQPIRTPGAVEAEIWDLHSRVDRSEYRLNSSSWRALSAAGNRFSASLNALPDGEHTLHLRAVDTWANQAESGPHRFIVDNTAPVITVEGVESGVSYRAPVSPVIGVNDLHLGTVSSWLNNRSFASGSAVTADGSYTLEVVARDRAGNRSARSVNFTVDRTPPALNILAPVDGTEIRAATVAVTLQTEPALEVTVRVGAWSRTASADAAGALTLDAVPLLLGVNRIEATATDRAGNVSPTAAVEVVRLADTGGLVGSLVTPGPNHPRGLGLELAAQVLNRSVSQPAAGRLRVRILAAAGEMLAQQSVPLNLAPGQTAAPGFAFATDAWPLGRLLLELHFDGPAESLLLASAGLDLLDARPPALAALLPQANALLANPALLRVRATDDDALAGVEYRLGVGPWLSLAAAAAANYETRIELADGAHAVEYRALDLAGNQTVLAPILFTLDSTPPQIQVEGVVDGGLYGAAVTPRVTVLDAHPDQLALRLNDKPFSSDTPISVSGSYRLHARATDRLGQVSERTLDFTLDLEPVQLTVDTPTEAAVLAAAQVSVRGRTKPGARVSLTGLASSHAVTAAGTGEFSIDGVALVPGANPLQLIATDRLGRTSPPVVRSVFRSDDQAAGIGGQLSLMPVEIAAGRPFEVIAQVRETLGAPRPQIEARIQIGRGADVLVERNWLAALGALEQQTSRQAFAPLPSVLGSHWVRLQVRIGANWQMLDETSFPLLDRDPPLVTVLAPVAGSFLPGPVALQVQADDALSAIQRVQARSPGGAWLDLASMPKPNLWAGALAIENEGAAALQVRAFDAAGNVSDIRTHAVTIDRSPPLISVRGVAENGLYAEPVRVSFTVVDATPVQTSATLNGQPLQSGQVVDTHGRHRLRIESTDAAGNRAVKAFEFELDLQAPGLRISAPVDNSIIRNPMTHVLGSTEPAATVELEVGATRRSIPADAKGHFRFDDVPLLIGANTIRARAIDRAGNTGAWSMLRVERRGGFALRGALELPPQLRSGQPLPVRVRIWNDAAHAQPAVRMRLIARMADARDRELDARRLDLAAGSASQYDLSLSTQGWPRGVVSLRLLASDEVEVLLASAQTELIGSTTPPVLARPQLVPVLGPGAILLMVLLMLGPALLRLHRAGGQG